MKTKHSLRTLLLAACMALAALSGVARADPVPLVNGEVWSKSSEDMKKADLVGMANLVLVETTYEGSAAPTDSQSILPRLAKGLKNHTLDTVREGLNKYYAANPDKLQRPVIEVIWFEMVVPGLKAN